MMKHYRRILAALAIAVLLQSCATKVPGCYANIYLDYRALNDAGFITCESDVPQGRRAIGQFCEVIKLPRRVPWNEYDNKREFHIVGRETDSQMVTDHLANTLRNKNAAGIANLKLSARFTTSCCFMISGTLFE